MAKKKEDKKDAKEIKESKEEIQDTQIDISEIKNELTDYIEIKIDKEVSKAVDKATKKLIRHKNSIIIRRDIMIVILIIVCFFLGYNLYILSSININITTTKKNSAVVNNIKKEIDEKVEEDNQLEKLTKKYKHLTDDIFINENSSYLKDYYEGNLTDEIKLYIALNTMDDSKIILEDDSTILEKNDLMEVYNKIFDSDFNPKSFKYDDLNFHYLSSKELFIADDNLKKEKPNIVKEIIDIKEDDNLNITTIEGLIKNKKLYNVISNKEIRKYNSDSLSNYEDSLTKVIYSFNKIENDYKLYKIEVL